MSVQGKAMSNKKIIRTKDGFRVTHINRRRACRLMCVECMGWELEKVDKCNGKLTDGIACPLLDFRNVRDKQNASQRNAAIRKHCSYCMGGNSNLVVKCESLFCPLYPYRNTTTDKTALFDFDMSDEDILKTGLNS